MVALAYSVAFEGIEARTVEVQCAVTPGIPGFTIVGLPDKSVTEARERLRAALTAMSIALPSRRITVNLSPADLPKEGSHFDLPIALALLAALDIVPRDAVAGVVAMGELSLDGTLIAVMGALPAAMAAAEDQRGFLCPKDCAAEAAWVGSVQVIGARTLGEVVRHYSGPVAASGRGTGRGPPARQQPRPARRQGPGARQAGAGNRGRRSSSRDDDRPARLRQIHAGGAAALDPAAPDTGGGAGNLDGALAFRLDRGRRHQPRASVSRAAPHRLDGGNRGRRARRQAGRGQPCP